MAIITGFEDIGLLILRVVFGIIFIKSGIMKVFTPSKPAKMMKMNVGMIFMVGLLELIGGAGVLLGYYTQIAAFGPAIVMLGALYFKLFVWKSKDYFYDLTLLAVALALIGLGAGGISVDSLLGI